MDNWIVAKYEIQDRIKNGKPQPPAPTALPLQAIQTISAVFQHRSVSDWTSNKHVQILLRSLKNSVGKPFEPLTVFWIGDAWALVDGHHRYKAYERYEFDEPVPVSVFNGTLEEAIAEALKANAHDKLAMTSKEKTNAAWRLVVGANLSINKTAELSSASRQTIVTMRKVRDAFLKKSTEGYLGTLDWQTARARYEGIEDNFSGNDDWLQKKATQIADRLSKTFGDELRKHPKVIWMALEIYEPNLLFAFFEQYDLEIPASLLNAHMDDDEHDDDELGF